MLKQLLKISPTFSEKQISNRFKTLANLLLTQCEIVKGNFHYDFLEIEFYYYAPNHRDPFCKRNPIKPQDTKFPEVASDKLFFHYLLM